MLVGASRMDARATGDVSSAFAAFYRGALGELYSYLGNRCASIAEAEDLAHDCFAAVLAAANKGTPEALTMPWLMGVARHKLVDYYRHENVRRKRLALFGRG